MRLMQRTAKPLSPPRHAAGIGQLLATVFLLGALGGCVSLNGADPTKRTPREVIDDAKIERQVGARIAADGDLATSHISIVSYDGIVLLTGQVEREPQRASAERTVAGVDGVRKIHNEIQVGGATNFVSRVNDGWLAAKVFSKFATDEHVQASSVKVVAENGVVYLIGLVPPAQGHAAAEAARTVFGVRKVVKVFDYLGEDA